MFYSQGATFRTGVGRLLLAQSPDEGGMDALVPELMQSGGSDTDVPEPFRTHLLERSGPETNALLAPHIRS